jgi:hypothetical protein
MMTHLAMHVCALSCITCVRASFFMQACKQLA